MIKLKKIENGVLTITMNDIVCLIPEIENYNWKVLWIDAISYRIKELHLPDGINYMKELMDIINNSSNGYSIESGTLLALSERLEQLVEFVLVGDRNKENLIEVLDDEKLKQKVEFFIELVDGSYWEITSKNERFNQRIIEKY